LTARWYALCSKPHKERVLWRQLKSKGYEVFYPRLRLPVRNPGGLKYKSYFPGYLFVKVDFKRVGLSNFQWMPNSEGLVCIDGLPAYVPDNLIEAIQRHLNELNSTSRKLTTETHQGEITREDGSEGDKGLLNPSLSDGERVQALLRVLDKFETSPELSSS
jgi:transcription antitermination factor NusG